MSGALPWTASKTAHSSPMLAPGTTPRPPTRPAREVGEDVAVEVVHEEHVEAGRVAHEPIAHASTMASCVSISGYRRDTLRATSRNIPSVSFMMLALWSTVTLRRPWARAWR
jgi:hypothetical protein